MRKRLARLAARRGGGEAGELSGSSASSHAASGLTIARGAAVDQKRSQSKSRAARPLVGPKARPRDEQEPA